MIGAETWVWDESVGVLDARGCSAGSSLSWLLAGIDKRDVGRRAEGIAEDKGAHGGAGEVYISLERLDSHLGFVADSRPTGSPVPGASLLVPRFTNFG